MPVAVIAISMLMMLVVATPSDASPPCMGKTGAWSGQNRCSEAKQTRRPIQNRKAQRDRRIHEVQRNIDRPDWRESMSEMLSRDEPVQTATQTPWIDRWVDIEPSTLSPGARWVDIAQHRSPSVVERKPEPMVSPREMLLAFVVIAIALTLATIEFLFRRTVY
jgi:hypothetical protein